MATKSMTVEINVSVHARTDKAFLVDNGNGHRVWVPRSQISDHTGDDESPESIFVPTWLAYEKGLI